MHAMIRGPKLKDRLDKATLVRLYEFSGLSTGTIAERFGVTSGKIHTLMDEYGIPRHNKRTGRIKPEPLGPHKLPATGS